MSPPDEKQSRRRFQLAGPISSRKMDNMRHRKNQSLILRVRAASIGESPRWFAWLILKAQTEFRFQIRGGCQCGGVWITGLGRDTPLGMNRGRVAFKVAQACL